MINYVLFLRFKFLPHLSDLWPQIFDERYAWPRAQVFLRHSFHALRLVFCKASSLTATLVVAVSRFKSESKRPSYCHNPTVQRYMRSSTFECVHNSRIPPSLFGNGMGLIDLTYPLSEDDKSIWPGNQPFRWFQTQDNIYTTLDIFALIGKRNQITLQI